MLAEQASRVVSNNNPLSQPLPNMSTAASGSSRCEASRVVKHILPSPTRGGPPRRKPPQMQSVGGPPRRAPPRVNGALVAAPAGRVASPKAVLIAKDDESDLELLSLSSDDDETKAPRAIVLGNQLLKAQGAVVDKSDDLWYDNDEEPQTWGGVDQAEVNARHLHRRSQLTGFLRSSLAPGVSSLLPRSSQSLVKVASWRISSASCLNSRKFLCQVTRIWAVLMFERRTET